MQVRVANDITHWVRFFLNGVTQTATKGRDVFQQILSLRTEVETSVMSLGRRAAPARQVLNLLYRKPMIDAGDIEESLGVATPTANTLISAMRDLGILKEVTGQQRHRIYVFERYLNLFVS